MKALVGEGPVPEGFDTDRLKMNAHSLSSKRLRSVKSSWPALAEHLGEDFDRLFKDFARTQSSPEFGGPMVDGRAFVDWLWQSSAELELKPIPNTVRVQALAVDLRYERDHDGRGMRKRRKRFSLATTTFIRPWRAVLGLRLPLIGERWFSFPPWPML